MPSSSPKSRVWRAVRRTAVLLALGCVTTVLTSWGLALGQSFFGGVYIQSLLPLSQDPVFAGLNVTEYRNTGAVRRVWSADLGTLDCEGSSLVSSLSCFQVPLRAWLEQKRLHHGSFEKDGPPSVWGGMFIHLRRGHCGMTHDEACAERLKGNWNMGPSATEDARGWPMLAMWGTVPAYGSVPTRTPALRSNVIVVSNRTPSGLSDPRVLPLTPIRVGFAVNVGFYALLWSLVLFVPGALRRRYRARHRRCPNCNYDLRNLTGDICPECGSTIAIAQS